MLVTAAGGGKPFKDENFKLRVPNSFLAQTGDSFIGININTSLYLKVWPEEKQFPGWMDDSASVSLTGTSCAAPNPWLPAGKPELADGNIFLNTTFC